MDNGEPEETGIQDTEPALPDVLPGPDSDGAPVDIIENTIKAELVLNPAQLSPQILVGMMDVDQNLYEKFAQVQSSISDLLHNYHQNLNSVAEGLKILTAKCKDESGERKNVEEFASQLRNHVQSFAGEAADFYTKLGKLYDELSSDLRSEEKSTSPPEDGMRRKKSAPAKSEQGKGKSPSGPQAKKSVSKSDPAVVKSPKPETPPAEPKPPDGGGESKPKESKAPNSKGKKSEIAPVVEGEKRRASAGAMKSNGAKKKDSLSAPAKKDPAVPEDKPPPQKEEAKATSDGGKKGGADKKAADPKKPASKSAAKAK